LFVFVG
jgi:hypothetical protein